VPRGGEQKIATLNGAKTRGPRDRYRPILKWAGGKARLVPSILPLLPASIDTYYEPFVGGAAGLFVFAALFGATFFTTAPLTSGLINEIYGLAMTGRILGAMPPPTKTPPVASAFSARFPASPP